MSKYLAFIILLSALSAWCSDVVRLGDVSSLSWQLRGTNYWAQFARPTTLIMAGYTSSDAFISITESGSVVGSASADSIGYFVFQFTGYIGDRLFALDSTDSLNLAAQLSVPITCLEGQATLATNLLFPPAISIDNQSVVIGDPLVVSGSAKPGCSIAIFTEAPLRSYLTMSGADSAWTIEIDTSDYMSGDYRAWALVADDGLGLQSGSSASLLFRITDE